MRWVQLCSSLNILWPCPSLWLEWKLTFSGPVSLIQVQSLWVCCDFYSHVLEVRTLKCSGEVTVAQTVGDGAGIHYCICLSILCPPPHFPLKTSACMDEQGQNYDKRFPLHRAYATAQIASKLSPNLREKREGILWASCVWSFHVGAQRRCLFVHSLDKYFLRTYYMPDTKVLGKEQWTR